MALEWHFGRNSMATVPAEIALISLYFSLLQGICQRTVRSGLDPPPASLSCRENRPSQNSGKSPQSDVLSRKPARA